MRTIDDDDLVRLLEEAGSSFALPAHGPAEVLEALAPAGSVGTVVPLPRRRWVRVLAAAATVAALVGGTAVAGAVLDDADTSTRIVAEPARVPASGSTNGAATGGSAAVGGTGGSSAYTGGEFTDGTTALQRSLDTSGRASADEQSSQLAARGEVPVPASIGLTPTGAKQTTTTTPVTAPAPDGPAERVLKTGSIALIVADGRVTPTLTAVQQIGEGAGGYVQDGSTQESGETPSGKVVLRIPVKQFESAVAKVRGLKAEVRSAATSGKDVTAQYTDLESQLKSLKATRERFLDILSRTRTIGEILSVQQRVDGVTAQIDKIEGQRRLLERQAEFSTLEVTVTEADDPVVTEREKPEQNGIVTAFGDAKDSFVDGVEALIRNSGTALLLLICAVGAFFVVRLGWRASRRRLV